jgi:hypothetical protein
MPFVLRSVHSSLTVRQTTAAPDKSCLKHRERSSFPMVVGNSIQKLWLLFRRGMLGQPAGPGRTRTRTYVSPVAKKTSRTALFSPSKRHRRQAGACQGLPLTRSLSMHGCNRCAHRGAAGPGSCNPAAWPPAETPPCHPGLALLASSGLAPTAAAAFARKLPNPHPLSVVSGWHRVGSQLLRKS